MNLQEIEKLIAKYELGESSKEEENTLRHFFSYETVPPHLLSYKYLFSFFDEAKNEEIVSSDFDGRILSTISKDKVIPISGNRRRNLFIISGIAASLIILFGFYFIFRSETKIHDTYTNPRLAYAETKRVLLMVSGNLNTGTQELNNLSDFNNGLNEMKKISSFDEGVKNLEKINVLDKSKKLITSKNNEQ